MTKEKTGKQPDALDVIKAKRAELEAHPDLDKARKYHAISVLDDVLKQLDPPREDSE